MRPRVALVEATSENCFGGGRHLDALLEVRREHAVSLHGVGLSIGSTDPLDERHLVRLAALVERVEPALVSDHLCWSSVGGIYANDLLPLPYTEEALAHVAERVERVQERLGRRILVENVSSYLEYSASEMSECEFLAALAQRAGCGVLLDVNNVYVSAANHGFDARTYLHAIAPESVHEVHLAGYSVNLVRRDDGSDAQILIDTHSRPVSEPVWQLYRDAIRLLGPKPTIVEWDADLPPLAGLVAEADKAERWLREAHAPNDASG